MYYRLHLKNLIRHHVKNLKNVNTQTHMLSQFNKIRVIKSEKFLEHSVYYQPDNLNRIIWKRRIKDSIITGATLVAAAACMCKNVSGESRYSALARAIAGTASNNFVITRPVAPRGGLDAVMASMILHSRRGFPWVSLLPVVAGREEEETAEVENPPCASRDGFFAHGKCRGFPPRLSLRLRFSFPCLLLFVSARVVLLKSIFTLQ